MADNPPEPSTTRSGRTVQTSSKAAEAIKSLLPNKHTKSKKTEKKTKKRTADDVQDSDIDSLNGTSAKKPSKIKKVKDLLSNISRNKKKKESNKTVSEISTPVSSKPAAPPVIHNVIEINSDGDVEGEATSSSDDEGTDEEVESEEESSDAELERLKETWKTPIYAFYHPEPEIGYKNGRRYHEFKCYKTTCKATVRRFLDKADAKSTGNLHRHAKKCWGEEVIETAMDADDVDNARKVLSKSKDGSVAAAFKIKGKGKVTYSHRQHTSTEARAEIVRWVTESARPYSIVKDRGFQSLMKTGRPHYYIPSPVTVSRDVRLVFARSRQRISSMLRKYDGKLHFATDAWTSPNHRAFVAVTVHFEHEGSAMCMILDIVEVARSHTGLNLAEAFADILEEFGIEDKVLGITCDNASNNDAMISELEDLLPEFTASTHTRCFLHINNLVARTLVRQFDAPKKTGGAGEPTNPEDDTIIELAGDIDLEERATREKLLADSKESGTENDDDDLDGWIDEMAALSQAERDVLQESARPVKLVLVKVRKLAFKVVNSTTLLLPAWVEAVAREKLKNRVIPRDVTTRWNSTYDMLVFVLEYRTAIEKFTADLKNDVRELELSDNEWAIVNQLADVLKVLKDATTFFSRSDSCIANVIPVMDIINDRLTVSANDTSLSPAIRSSLGLAKKTLNRYYSKTDDVEVFRIAMILHPKYKLQYFKDAQWDMEWVDVAEEIIRNRYNKSYATLEKPSEAQEASPTTSNKAASLSKNMFDTMLSASGPSTSRVQNELDRYLSTDIENTEEPLKWWWEHKAMYPCLSRMARDYLSIPATSVDVERVFSRGRLVLPYVRNRLSAQSTRAQLCLGNWSLRGHVHDNDVLVASRLPDVEGEDEVEFEDGWDKIEL